MVILPASSSGLMVLALSTRTASSFCWRIISTGPPSFFSAELSVAVADDFHHRKAPFQDGLFHELIQQGGVVHRAPPHHGGPGAHGHLADGKGVFHVAVPRSGGLRPIRRGRRVLAAGHAVDIVVDDDGGQIQVAPGRMDKVVATDGGGVAVTHNHDHLELWIGQFHACGKGQGPAVGGVEGVEIHVHAQAAGAADPGYQDDIIFFKPGAVDGPDQRPQDDAVAAPGHQTWGNFFSWRKYLWISLVTSDMAFGSQ